MLHHCRMSASPNCSRCNAPLEDVIYITRDCPHSLQIWKTLKIHDTTFFSISSTSNWLRHGINSRSPALLLAGILWAWCARNSTCITNDTFPLFKLDLEINYLDRVIEGYIFQASRNPEIRWVLWHPSCDLGFILNVDGSCAGNPGNAGIGGSIRDNGDNWVIGFAGHLRIQDNLFAKLTGLYCGVRLDHEKGNSEAFCVLRLSFDNEFGHLVI